MVEPLFALSIAFGIASMASFGISNFLSSVLSKKSSHISIVFWYFLVSGIILGIAALALSSPPAISTYELLLLAMTAILSAAGFLVFLEGLKRGKLSIIAPVSGAWAIVTVLIGLLLLNERLGTIQIAGVALTILGTILTSLKIKDIMRLKFSKALAGIEYAIAAMLIWGFLYAGIGILSKALGWAYPISIIALGSAALVLIYSIVKGVKVSFPGNGRLMLIAWVLITTFALLAYSIGANYGNIALVSPIVAASPFITVAFGVLILKEKLERNQFIGIIIIILGLVLIAI